MRGLVSKNRRRLVSLQERRLHRKRRREGTHYVRIPLESFEIEGLIRLKVLPKAHREDAKRVLVNVRFAAPSVVDCPFREQVISF
jgi:hypothetical protein